MTVLRWALAITLFVSGALANTLGTVVPLVGGASDIVLDEARNRLYLVNGSQDRIEVYSVLQRRFTGTIRTDSLPISAAMSRSGKYLYVTSHNGSALDVIDLDTQSVVNRISLPARPEGVAVGGDERVLITTIGTGPGNAANTLLVYDPNATDTANIANVLITPPAPQPPQLPALAGRIFLATRSQLIATQDGTRIIGLNAFNQNTRVVFVYDVASSAVLKSRYVGDLSTVLSVSPDGSKFMVGLRLFETDSLTVLAQMNAANVPFPLSQTLTTQGFTAVAQQFNLQQNQGGSVFAPDGSYIFAAFNIAPVQIPAARANVTQMFVADPENLLVSLGLQLPENLAGKMIVSSDGSAIFGLSESGFTIISLAQLQASPIATPNAVVSLLANDQCGVTADLRSAKVDILNDGRGRMTATATLLQSTTTGGLGGNTGPGGGIIGGGGIIVVVPPTTGAANQTQTLAATAPTARVVNTPDGPQVQFGFNPQAGRAPGTMSHDFLIQSSEAVNIPNLVRVFQNQRDTDARSEVIPVPGGISINENLMDMVADTSRQRLYISNSGLNRVDVFDMRQKQFIGSIKVGQLPHSLALTPDANTLYVANTGGESISIVDLNKLVTIGRVRFPPIPFNGNLAILTPSVIAATQRGLQVVMSNGTLWTVIGDEAIPRKISPIIQTATVPAPRSMTSTPNGEYALLLDGSGYAYLYDALADEYVQRRQVTSTFQGYYGPIAAGPRGRYYLVNGLVLNETLTPILSAGSTSVTAPGGRPGTAPTTVVRPISAVAAAGNSTFARFAQPARSATTSLLTETPVVELVDATTGATLRSSSAVEGPLSTVVGNARVNTLGRAMAVDATNTNAYVLTTSGLTIVPLDPVVVSDRPSINPNGIVSLASFQPKTGPGGLISIFGRNMGTTDVASTSPLPAILGGVCVTMNNVPLPLLMTSPTQINAQVPLETAIGRYPVIVRSTDKKTSSPSQTLTLTKYAPAVLVDADGLPAIYRRDAGGSQVSEKNPTKRDDSLIMYAIGLGLTKGPKVTTGMPAPALAVTDPVSVFFGDPTYKEAAIIVESSTLIPGLIGVYQVDLRVPGAHISSKGRPLNVTLRIGGVDSPVTGPAVPQVWVE